jgi:fibronectin type 3 domain-containing protein
VSDLAGSHPLTLSGDASVSGRGATVVPPDVMTSSRNGAVTLRWTERTGPNDANAASEFKVYRTEKPGGSRQSIATVQGDTSYTDEGISNNTTYHYEVASVNGDGTEGDFSPPSPATPYDDRGGAALSFSTGGYASVENRPALKLFETSYSIELWIKHDGNSAEDADIITKFNGSNGYTLSLVGSGEAPTLNFTAHRAGSFFQSNRGIPAGRWTHVAVTYDADGDTQRLYINGELDATNSGADGPRDTDETLWIGANEGGASAHFSGQIDNLRIWTDERTPSEIEASYTAEVNGNEPDLTAAWQFNDRGRRPALGTETDFGHEKMTLMDGTGSATQAAPGADPLPPFHYATTGDGEATVQWTPRAPSESSEQTVYRSTSADGANRQSLTTTTNTSYEDSTPSNGTTYFYEVTNTNADGQESDYGTPLSLTPGTRGINALTLDGDLDHAVVDDRPALDLNSYTIEAWIKHDGNSPDGARLLSKFDGSGFDGGYTLSLLGGGDTPTVKFTTNRAASDITSESEIPVDQWTHVAVTYDADGSTQRLYINGQLDATNGGSAKPPRESSKNLWIGAEVGGASNFFSGQIDNLRIWNTERSQAEIRQSFLGEVVGNESGLVGAWRFDENSGPAYSITGRRLTATLKNDAALTTADRPTKVLPPSEVAATEDGEEVTLTWRDTTGLAPTKYRIYRSTAPIDSVRPAPDSLLYDSTDAEITTFTDSDVSVGETYYYRLTAVDFRPQESGFSGQDYAFLYPQEVTADATRSFGDASGPGDYRLVALPGEVDRSLSGTLSGEAGVEWQAFWDNGAASEPFVRFDGGDTFTFEPGRGFWLTGRQEWSVSDTYSTVPLPADTAASIPLNDGWTIVSNPFDQAVPWAAVERANGGDLQPLWPFGGTFDDTTTTFASALSGRAYYFLNDNSNRDSLVVPYPGAPPNEVVSQSKAPDRPPLLALSATPARQDGPSSTVRMGRATSGRTEKALIAPTGRFEPVSLRIQRPDAEAAPTRRRFLLQSRRAVEGDGTTFSLRLTRQEDGPVELHAENLDAVGESSVALLRPSTGQSHDLRSDPTITLNPNGQTAEFRVVVGTEAYVHEQRSDVVPDEVRLTAYPNPVRTNGTVAYALPEETDVTLRVYDVLGRQVATLAAGTKEAGRHTVPLNTDQLSSGVYFGRLKAGGQTRTRKITVVR